MIYLIRENGQIVQRVDAPDEHAEHYESDGLTVLVSGDIFDNGKVYHDGTELIEIPDKPSEFHVWDWDAKLWVADAELAATSARTKRNALLAASDWTQLPDVQLETKTAWATFRQVLRDITDQAGFPFDITWPEAPNN